MFPATTRTFTKDTALSEQGRGAAWRVWINARHGRRTAWARHGHGMLCVNPPLQSRKCCGRGSWVAAPLPPFLIFRFFLQDKRERLMWWQRPTVLPSVCNLVSATEPFDGLSCNLVLDFLISTILGETVRVFRNSAQWQPYFI